MEGLFFPFVFVLMHGYDRTTLTLFFLAAVCSTAVRNPVGKVNADIQKRTGGWVVDAHLENCSTRTTRSRVHEPSGFLEGYA